MSRAYCNSPSSAAILSWCGVLAARYSVQSRPVLRVQLVAVLMFRPVMLARTGAGSSVASVLDGGVAAGAGEEPLVELILGKGTRAGAVVAGPVQQGQSRGDAGADVPGGGGAGQAAAALAAGTVDEEPVRVGLDQAGMTGRPGGEELVEPGRDPLKVLVAGGQDPGADQDVADVVHGLGGGQRV